MSYPVLAGIKFLVVLLIFAVSFVLVGRALRRVLFSLVDLDLPSDLVLGFLAAPVLVGVLCFITRQPLWIGLIVVDAAAIALLLWPRREKISAPPAERPDPLILPLQLRWPGLLIFLAVAIAINVPYISGLLAIPASGGRVDIEPYIFDLEPAIGVTTSLTAYGFPPPHHSARSVPMLYYTGFYVMPAAVAGLARSLLTMAIVAQYIFGSLVYLIVGWQLLSRHIVSTRWRVAALCLCLCGSTLGVYCWHWSGYFEGTFLEPYLRMSLNHDTILQSLLWTPRHAIPEMLALLVLEAFSGAQSAPLLLRRLFFPVVFLFSSSIYVGLWIMPAILVGLALSLLSPNGKLRKQLHPSACFVFAILAGLALLPHYYTTILAFTHAGAPTGRLTTALLAPSVLGHVLTSCGLGLVVSVSQCFRNGRQGLLWGIYLLTLLGAVLTSTFNSDFMCKGTTSLMVVAAFLTSLAVYQLWEMQKAAGLWRRSLALAALLLIVVYSLQSLATGLYSGASVIPQTFSYRHRVTRDHFELVRWVRQHTKPDQTVSLVLEGRTDFEPWFERPAFAAGPGSFYYGQDIWADSFFLKRHASQNSDLCDGILGSDYVCISREPMGFGYPKTRDNAFDQHKMLIQSLGLTIVKENAAGLIAKNPPRTSQEKQALRAQWSVVSLTNGYHSAVAPSPDAVKWVQVDLGRSTTFDEIRLIPARPQDFPDTPGFGFPARFRVEVAGDPSFRESRVIANETSADVPNPGDKAYRIPVKVEKARYVRVTATRLWHHDKDYWFALAELEVRSKGENLAMKGKVSALDSIEGGLWSCRYLIDGYDSRRRLDEITTTPANGDRADLRSTRQ